MPLCVQLHPHDNTAVAMQDIAVGTMVHCPDHGTVAIREAIPLGHKISLQDIETGQSVRKYGQPIGIARMAIAVGSHIHTHNLASELTADFTKLVWHPDRDLQLSSRSKMESLQNPYFYGYLRRDKRSGIRNEIWILPTVGCINAVVTRLQSQGSKLIDPQIKIQTLNHPYGCSQLGDDLHSTRALLAALATHPNAGAVFVVGLGCETNDLTELLKKIGPREHLYSYALQDNGDNLNPILARIREVGHQLKQEQRQRLPLSTLRIGVKCGGSDPFSGISANPLVGHISDTLIDQGCSILMSEIPEMFGAEHLLLQRCANETLFVKLKQLFLEHRDDYRRNQFPIDANPSPGNIRSGITTLAEKSLAAIEKGGARPIQDVLDYGEIALSGGLTIVSAPGNDLVSVTALAAAGANLILFTTGLGTPAGGIVPVLKIASNKKIISKMPSWFDFDSSPLLENPEQEPRLRRALLHQIQAIASGEQSTQSEILGDTQIAIWKKGVTL